MHETAKRLLSAGLARGEKDFTGIARRFGASDQSATNWKSRGVPKAVIIRAAAEWNINPGWLSAEAGSAAPDFVERRTGLVGKIEAAKNGLVVAQPVPSYAAFTEEEKRLLAGFRVADGGARRAMLLLADDCLARFPKRSEGSQ
jgi:hypothetical protein